MNKYSILPDENGGYLLGPESEYYFSKEAVSHVIDGDFSKRLLTRDDGSRYTESILKGGLHTCEAWIKFKQERGDVVHGWLYDSSLDRYWYYARTLQNGVVLLKIPHDMFQSGAAKNTLLADYYYKSGYLWKTLFPKDTTRGQAVEIINEALHNLSEEECDGGVLIGYARVFEPLKALRIRIQVRGNKILSAFPSWDQPMSGNNGKPYSHQESIMFRIASSTEFFDDETDVVNNHSKLFLGEFSPLALKIKTPHFLKKRPAFISHSDRFNAIQKWREQLRKHAESMGMDDVSKLFDYYKDWVVTKSTYSFMQDAYSNFGRLIANDLDLKNSVAVYQNAIDVVYCVSIFDNKNSTTEIDKFIKHYLRSKFINTGGLDLWESCRMHRLFSQLAADHHSKEIIDLYYNEMFTSPNRMGAYFEFNFNKFVKYNPSVIGINYTDEPMFEKHYYEFSMQDLSMNYFTVFDEKYRRKVVNGVNRDGGENTRFLIKHAVGNATGDDFNFFSSTFSDYVDGVCSGKYSCLDVKVYKRIMHDYFRCQVELYWKIAARYAKKLSVDPDFSKMKSKKTINYIQSKHERDFILINCRFFLEAAKKLFLFMGEKALADKAEENIVSFARMRPPLPKMIPYSIKSWRHDQRHMGNDKDVGSIFSMIP